MGKSAYSIFYEEDLYQVLHLLLCIPNGTAELERIFSVVKTMKDKKRSRLKAKKLADMITIYYYLSLEEGFDEDALFKCFRDQLEEE